MLNVFPACLTEVTKLFSEEVLQLIQATLHSY